MKIFIVGAKRTAVGSMLGGLKSLPASELGAIVVRQLLADTSISASVIDEVIVGNVLSAGQGQGVGRQVAIKAGIPDTVPAYAVSMVCGSGLKAISNAYAQIKAGLANCIIAGGAESMSRAPMLIPCSVRTGTKMGDFNIVDHMIFDALTDAYSGVHMGITAENIAKKHNITRKMQDDFAYQSQQKAIKAVDGGVFDKEIVPITIKEKKSEYVFARDEHPNRTSTPEKLANLRPAFDKAGSVTAGNASGINDGAAFVMVASEQAVKEYNLTPLVEIVSVGQGGVDPQVMGLGPVPAIRQVLKNANMTLDQMELIELNEAFAAQSLGVIAELVEEHKIDRTKLMSRTNINGGAIALGHPVGASGSRILVTLIYELLSSDKQVGLASLCIGGGMGEAMIVKKI